MKTLLGGLVVGLGLLASGCAATVPAREAESPVPMALPEQLPPASSPGSGLTPPAWYWMQQPQRRLENQLQQQWNFYQQNRTPAPQFPRPLNCQSIQTGGQIVTNCY